MQLLLSAAALDRVKDRLTPLAAGLDVVVLDGEGALRRDDRVVAGADVDPELFWVSADLYASQMLPAFMGHMFRGTKGQWAQVFFAGIDNPAIKGLMAKGVRLTKSSAQAAPIAEYVVSHALSLLHPIAAQADAQAKRAWTTVPFREIASSTWLLIGHGSIGTEIEKRIRPFGVELIVVRRSGGDATLADLPSVLPRADVVVLACALNDATRGMADAKFFAALKPGAILINIGRGGLVDELALREGLARDQPGHAVLDVFETEPLPADAWFWTHPKVRVTAHTSNAGDGVIARGDTLFLENLRRFRNGEPLLNEASRQEVGL